MGAALNCPHVSVAPGGTFGESISVSCCELGVAMRVRRAVRGVKLQPKHLSISPAATALRQHNYTRRRAALAIGVYDFRESFEAIASSRERRASCAI